MREPYTQLYVHLVWATWDRAPLITSEMRAPLYACMQAECRALKAEVLAIGGVANHVHILVRYPASVDVSRLVKQIKGASSHLATHCLAPDSFFKWQGAYGAFSVDKSRLTGLRDYILHQVQHHQAGTFDPDQEFEE